MDSGLYTAYSGLRATADMLDVLSNNLANVNTTGFKADQAFVRVYNRAISADDAGPLDADSHDPVAARAATGADDASDSQEPEHDLAAPSASPPGAGQPLRPSPRAGPGGGRCRACPR